MRLLKPEADRVSKGKGRGRSVKAGGDRGESCGTQLREATCLSPAVEGVDGRSSQQPISFWLSDGSCFEGTTERLGKEFIFIGSRMLAPVGATIMIQPTQPNTGGPGVLEAAEATVVWHCPVADHFKNLKGFGVRLHGSGSLAVGSATSNSPKEAG